MKLLPKISIVTPSFNQGKYIEKTILSVLEQGYPNLEYIIIDGGSTDESVEIIKKYADRLTYWESEPDRGQSHAINKGFERATGEIFGWLNSDDWYHPGALQAVAEAFAANPEAGAVVGAGEMVDEEGTQLIYKAPIKVDLDFLYHWVDDFFWQPSCFFTKKAWDECGSLDEAIHYAMDLDLWMKIANNYAFVSCSKLLSTSLKHDEAKTAVSESATRIEASLVIMKYGGESKAREYLFSYFINKDLLFERQLAAKSRLLAECEAQLLECKQKSYALLNSLSWKVTMPFRMISDQLLTTLSLSQHRASQPDFEPCNVNPLFPLREKRKRVVHALANFMAGGSSRLVVDLIERLGHIYEQEVITWYLPPNPAYIGVPVHEFRILPKPDKIVDYLEQWRPDLLHVHYWGSTDTKWYEQIFSAAERYGCKIIENVNTPVEPYFSKNVDHYVYVSQYVLNTFGRHDRNESVIYPGSNFRIFVRNNSHIPDNCIGMVYRLEKDKLNKSSIDAFIKVAKRRPATRVLIVGGGYFLEPYKEAVKAAGVIDSFVFTNYVAYGELPALYEQMSLFVCPVWQESFGQVSPFAMNMGIPVVGYNVGALSEIIGTDELLAVPGDSDSLADIIIDLLDNREKRLSVGRANYQRAQKFFSVEKMALSFEKLYQKLLEERH